MRFIRNWVIPFFSTVIFAFIGLLITGASGYNIVMTFDGQPIEGGPTPEQVDATIARGKGSIVMSISIASRFQASRCFG